MQTTIDTNSVGRDDAAPVRGDGTAAPLAAPAGGLDPLAPVPPWFRLADVRSALRTTPARLRLLAVLIVAGAVTFGVLASEAASNRREAVQATERQIPPLLVAARLSASLSDANATAASTLLIGGLEPLRQRYLGNLGAASRDVAWLAGEIGRSEPERAMVRLITERLPIYSGLVDTARANSRHGYPVGAAYLRRASGIMGDKILPAAGRVYEIEARSLHSNYGAASSNAPVIYMLVAGGVLVAVLVGAQLYLARVTRRILNPGLVAASAALVALLVWLTSSFLLAQDALVEAQHRGSDSVEILSVTRILALRARAEKNLALVARGGGSQNAANFKTITARLGRDDTADAHAAGGLFAVAARLGARSGTARAIDELHRLYKRYRSAHRVVEALVAARPPLTRTAQFRASMTRAVGAEVRQSGALNAGLSTQTTAAQRRFDASAQDASSALRGLPVAIPLLTLACAALALLGLNRRINEYR